MTKTDDNLKAAFAGESQANRMYLAFAKVAQEEGFPQIAKLFKAAAEAETVHAHNHLRVMGGIKTTIENLQAAIEGEGHEFRSMYPKFVAEAQRENFEIDPVSGEEVQKIVAEIVSSPEGVRKKLNEIIGAVEENTGPAKPRQ